MGEAFVRIRPDDAGFSNEAEKGILSKVGGIASKAAGLFAAGFVAKQGFDFLGGLVKDASESRRVLAETEQAIKATGGAANVSAKDITSLADALSKKTGIDDEAIQTGENLLLTFKSIRNETGKGNDIFNQATAAVLDLSKQFGGIEASSVQVGKALNDPVAGVTALTRVGIQFTDQQKEQIKTLVESGRTLEAQKIILGEINSQVGGQAAAQATAIDKLKVTYGNLREELGTRLLPIVDKVATFLADRLPGALDKTGKVLGPVIRGIVTGLALIRSGFIEGNVSEKTGFLGFLVRAGVAAKVAVGVIKDAVIGLFAFITKGDFTGAFARAFNVEEDSPIVGILFRVRDAFFTVVEFVRNNVKPVLLGVAAAFLVAAGPVVAVIAGLVLLYARFQFVRDIVLALVDAYFKYVSFLTGTVIPAVVSFVQFLVAQFSNLADFVRENWAGIQEAISHVIVVVRAIIEGFIAGVQAAWRIWGDEILNVVRIAWDQIRNIIDTVIGIISGLIRAGIAIINGDWGKAWDAIKDILSTAWDFIVETVTNALRVAREVVEAEVSGIVAFFGGVPGQIKDKLESLVGFLADVGERAVRAMADAIGNAIHWVLEKAGDLVSKVKDKLTFWDSPPELFGLHVGQRLVRGMAQGLGDTGQVTKAATALVSSVKKQINDGLKPNAFDDFGRPFFIGSDGKPISTGDPNARFNDETQIAGNPNFGKFDAWEAAGRPGSFSDFKAGNQTMILSITGPLVVVEGSIAPGQEAAVAAAAEEAVVRMVRNGTVGREMTNRTAIISRR